MTIRQNIIGFAAAAGIAFSPQVSAREEAGKPDMASVLQGLAGFTDQYLPTYGSRGFSGEIEQDVTGLGGFFHRSNTAPLAAPATPGVPAAPGLPVGLGDPIGPDVPAGHSAPVGPIRFHSASGPAGPMFHHAPGNPAGSGLHHFYGNGPARAYGRMEMEQNKGGESDLLAPLVPLPAHEIELQFYRADCDMPIFKNETRSSSGLTVDEFNDALAICAYSFQKYFCQPALRGADDVDGKPLKVINASPFATPAYCEFSNGRKYTVDPKNVCPLRPVKGADGQQTFEQTKCDAPAFR